MDGRNDERVEVPSSPYFRVWMCGAFRVERLADGSSGIYQPVRTAEWGGSNYPRLFLKALLCCPGRRVRRETILEMLWPGSDLEQAIQNLNTATTKLRRVLCLTKESESLLVTNDDSSSYVLEGQQFLWTDADAALVLLKEAESIGRTAFKALPLLEEATDYLHAGSFLEDEEGEWAQRRRGYLDEAHYNGRLWLAEAYEQQGMAGQAEIQLRTLLADDPTDEDVLCRLMSLLHRLGMIHKAWRLYQQTAEQFTREGRAVSEGTRILAEQLHTDHLPSPMQQISVEPLHVVEHPAIFSLASGEWQMPYTSSKGGVWIPASTMTSLPFADTLTATSALQFILKEYEWRELIRHYYGQVPFCGTLQAQLSQEFDAMQHTQDEEDKISRRQAIGTVVALPFVILTKVRTQQLRLQPDEFLPECAASLAACWSMLNGDGLSLVEQMLPTYLPTLVVWAKQSSRHQYMAAYLGAQGALLMDLVAYHRGRFRESLAYAHQAVELAQLSGDRNLFVYALILLGGALNLNGQPKAMLQKHQEAERYSDQVVLPLQSYVFAELAYAYALNGQVQQAIDSIQKARDLLPDDFGEVPYFVSAHYGVFQLVLFEGYTYLALGENRPDQARRHSKQASQALARIEQLPSAIFVPQRLRVEITNSQAAAAVGERNRENFEKFLLAGAQGAKALGSEKRRQEVLENWRAGKNAWRGDAKILTLADALI